METVPHPRNRAEPVVAVARLRRRLERVSAAGMNRLLTRRGGGASLRFVPQSPTLLADGLHYEERIARRGIVATRQNSTHDLFNALIWLRHPALKRAMNARQVADIARVGPKQRTRGQYALTHFDEAGAIVWITPSAPIVRWDTHDWRAFFLRRREDWGITIAVTVIGHALFDYVLVHGELPVAKALAVRAERTEIAKRCDGALIVSWPEAEARVADAIAKGRLLADPQELRPLPLAGIPGWHEDGGSDAFYERAPCFRPLRPGRRYPRPFEASSRECACPASTLSGRTADGPPDETEP